MLFFSEYDLIWLFKLVFLFMFNFVWFSEFKSFVLLFSDLMEQGGLSDDSGNVFLLFVNELMILFIMLFILDWVFVNMFFGSFQWVISVYNSGWKKMGVKFGLSCRGCVKCDYLILVGVDFDYLMSDVVQGSNGFLQEIEVVLILQDFVIFFY